MYSNYNRHYFETRYIVTYPQSPTDKFFRASIEPVFKLFEINPVDKTKQKQTMIIDQRRYANIALIDIHEKSIDELRLNGAQLLDSAHVYKDEIDAGIQLAFVCSKFMVEPADVYEATNGHLNSGSYKQLLKLFYNDYPEKYI